MERKGGTRKRESDKNVEDSALPVREILANCGHPIEEVIEKVLIPKLFAKKHIFLRNAGEIEVRIVDDHDIQLKACLALAKLCGYSAEKVVEVNVDQTNSINMSEASDHDLREILKIASRSKGSARESRMVQAVSNDLAPGG